MVSLQIERNVSTPSCFSNLRLLGVKDLEAKNTTLIQEKTRVQRDRDIAVAGLVKFKTELSSNRFGNNY